MTNCLMNNDEQTGRVLDYCAGRLDPETARQVARHVETCPDCASLASVWKSLDAWEAPPVSADFNRRLYARIAAADAMPWYRRWLDSVHPLFAQPALSLAAATVVVVTGFLLDNPASKTTVPHAIVSVTDAEQVEKTLDDLEMLRQFDVSSDHK
jgi:anti-sigma factor RsiW